MSHARKQIREAAATLLRATPSTWGTVFESRLPTTRAVMPYLMIFSDGEASQKISANSPAVYSRTANIVISGRLRLPGNNDKETIEDKMDAVAVEVETKLTYTTLQAVITQLQSLTLLSTEQALVVGEDDSPQYAEVTLTFAAGYATLEGSPATLI